MSCFCHIKQFLPRPARRIYVLFFFQLLSVDEPNQNSCSFDRESKEMLSRLISPATKSCRSRALLAKTDVLERGLATDYREKVMPTGRSADPAVFSGEQDDEAGEVAKHEDSILQGQKNKGSSSRQRHGYVPPRTPFASSHHLESTEVSPPIDPSRQQQKRSINSAALLEQASCDVAIDGWPSEGDDDGRGRKRQVQVQELDEKEYYKDHKTSPLAELEIADTRKPMARATDGTADYYMSEGGIVVFREEHRDTAEDSLTRAAEIWRENAMRGDPDSPHGRVLRALRGEHW